MTSPKCARIRSEFSPYLDGAVTGQQMLEIAQHLDECSLCQEEFEALRSVQQSLAMLGPAKVPADLGMRLRVAISHEKAAAKARWFDGLVVKWENTVRPMLVQVSAGFAGSVALVGCIMLLLGMVAAPEAVMANDDPLSGVSAPHYLYSAVEPRAIVTANESLIIVEADVDERGRVYDYRIASGPTDATVRQQVIDQLLLSVCEPAKVFGSPVRGRVVMTFSGISVSG